jgi:hypothetical protein
MLGGICALLHVRKQGSPQRHGGTEQKGQVIGLVFFSVSLCLCGDSLLRRAIKGTDSPKRVVYDLSSRRISSPPMNADMPVLRARYSFNPRVSHCCIGVHRRLKFLAF